MCAGMHAVMQLQAVQVSRAKCCELQQSSAREVATLLAAEPAHLWGCARHFSLHSI